MFVNIAGKGGGGREESERPKGTKVKASAKMPQKKDLACASPGAAHELHDWTTIGADAVCSAAELLHFLRIARQERRKDMRAQLKIVPNVPTSSVADQHCPVRHESNDTPEQLAASDVRDGTSGEPVSKASPQQHGQRTRALLRLHETSDSFGALRGR